MKASISLCFFSLSFCLLACYHNNSHKSNVLLLQKAAFSMREHPDSALSYLSQIADVATLVGKEQADYCLLMTQAMDKKNLPLSDSLIRVATNYYADRGHTLNKAKALFYKGRVLQEQGNKEAATLLYKQVETMIPSLDDYYLMGLVYSYLGHLNREDEDYQKAYSYYEKALTMYRIEQNALLITAGLQDLAKVCLYLGEVPQADSLFNEVLSRVSEIDSMWQSNVYHNVSVFYLATGQFDEAEQAVKSSLSTSFHSEDRLRSYALLATIYTRQNRRHLADALWEKALKSENIYTRKLVCASLLEKSLDEQDFGSIEKYVPLYIQYTDSIYRLSQDKRIVEIQRRYDHEVLIAQNKVDRLLLCCSLLLLLLFMVSLVYLFKVYSRYKRTKECELIKQRLELDSGKQMLQEMSVRIEKMRHEIEIKMEKEHHGVLLGRKLQETVQEKEILFQDLTVLQMQLHELNKSRLELIAELSLYKYFYADGLISEDCYKVVVTHYSLYNFPLVTFLRDPRIGLTSYESLLCIFSYEHLSVEEMEQKLGKSKNTLNKALMRTREKLRVREGVKAKISSLGDFLRSKF